MNTDEKNPAAVELARLAWIERRKNPDKLRTDAVKAGKAGAKARAKSLTPERRREIALKAVAAREAKRKARKEAEPPETK